MDSGPCLQLIRSASELLSSMILQLAVIRELNTFKHTEDFQRGLYLHDVNTQLSNEAYSTICAYMNDTAEMQLETSVRNFK